MVTFTSMMGIMMFNSAPYHWMEHGRERFFNESFIDTYHLIFHSSKD